MIKILPCEDSGSNYTKIGDVCVAGAIFDLENQKLLLSFPADDYAFTGIVNEKYCVLWRYEKNIATYRFFDYTRNTFIAETPLQDLIYKLDFPNKIYVELSDESANTTIINNLNGEQLICFDEYLGELTGDINKYLYFSAYGKNTCVSIDENKIIWQIEQEGYLHVIPNSDLLLFCDNYTTEGKTILTWRNWLTGEIEKENKLSYDVSVSKILADRLTFTTFKNDKRFILHYDLKTDEIYTIDVNKDFWPVKIIDEHYYSYLDESEENDNITAHDSTFIKRYALETGEPRGVLHLPNVCFKRSPDYFETPAGMGTIGTSRLPWFEEYQQLILWDKDDFDDPNPKIRVEPLFGQSERLMVGKQAYYRVFVEQDCESFFQLHRQFSVALYRTATMNGGNLNYTDKTKDDAFHGKIICDVSNHSLSEPEKFAVIHMCEHLEAKLLLWYFRAGNSNKQQIKMEPKFE